MRVAPLQASLIAICAASGAGQVAHAAAGDDTSSIGGQEAIAAGGAAVAAGQAAAALLESASAGDTVIVTATRRKESLEDVPVSIVAISQDDLNVAGVKRIDDLAAIVPGVEFGRPNFGGQISYIAFRGLTTVAGASTIGVYVDETPIQGRINPAGYSFFGNPYPALFDLNRVEALRGPQGTLFGASSEGGAVRFIFNEPNLSGTSGLIHSEVSSTDNGGVSFDVGIAGGAPIVEDSLGFRASAYYRSEAGYIDRIDPFTLGLVDQDADSSSTAAFRLALTKAFGDNVTVTPSIHYQKTDVDDQSVFQRYAPGNGPGPAGFQNVRLIAQPSEDEFYVAALDVEVEMPGATFSSVTSYYSRDANTLIDVTNLFGFFSDGYGDPRGMEFPSAYSDAARQPAFQTQRNFSQEVRFASDDPEASIQWLLGAFYSNARQLEDVNMYSTALAEQIGEDPASALLYTGGKTIDSQIAVFGQVDVRLAEGLNANLGVRAAHYKSDFTQFSGGYYNDGVPPVAAGEQAETPVTPKVGLTYSPNDDSMFYATVSRGYRVGGANSPLPDYCEAPAPETYDSDYVWSYEIGTKNRFFDRKLHVDASAFYLQWKNIQENLFLPCGFGFNANAGDAVSKGFDIALQLDVTPGLRLGLSAAYSDTKHVEDAYYAGFLVVHDGDSVGALPQVVAPWNINASLRYDFALSDQITGYFFAEDRYRSSNPGPFASNIPESVGYFPDFVPNPETNLVNLRLGLEFNALEASFFVNNLTNEQPLLYKNVDVPGSNIIAYSTLRPRTFGISLDYSF